MVRELLMAVDLGTSFVKSGVYDLNGECIAVASEAVRDERPAPGIFIQHGEELVDSVIRCIRKAADQIPDRMKDVEAIAFTGQMAGFMGVDKNWNDVTGWSCSLDTRFTPYAEKQMKQLSDEFLSISGTNSPLFSTKYEWFKNDYPREADRIAKYLMISGYVIGKLGEVPIDEAVMDGSFLAWTGLADVKNRSWSEVICEKLKIPERFLPRISQSNEIVGHLSKKAAETTGLRSGIALISGAGDKIAGCVGANVLKKGDMIFEAASYAGLSCLVDDFRPDYEQRYFDILDGAFPDDLYAHYYIPGSGITLNWFMDHFARKGEESLGEAFARMDAKVGQIPPGSEGLMAIGMMGGTAMPFDGALKGVWMGFNWVHREEHFYRALQESFSYAVSTAIDRINAKYPDCGQDTVKIIGGGARSRVWTQMLADVSQKTFERLDREDIALWGACLLAADGIGLFGDVRKAAEEHVHVKEVYRPNRELAGRYAELKEQYNRYAKELSPYCKALKS
ncbi:FGGY family carbohydrate kinase [Lachnospiraceae bacterium 56-18]